MALTDNIGVSFLPSTSNYEATTQPRNARLEDIFRILSLRLPKFLGARPIAPGELLTSPGGAALPSGGGRGGDPIADTIARHVLDNLPGSGGGAPGGAANPAGSFAPVMGGGFPGGGGGGGDASDPAGSSSGPSVPYIPQAPPKPRIHVQGPTGGEGFTDNFDDLGNQLRRGQRRIS